MSAVDDIVYPPGFYSHQAPLLLDYVAAVNGVAPPVADGSSFTYLDLGCGDGFTIVLLAAAYPRCRFVGVDLNPAHIAAGTALAKAGGLDNVRLIEGRFEDWRALDLPQCDYVAMHGVWTWVGESARGAAIEMLQSCLREGGLLYISYNANPGWAAMAPLRQFFRDYMADRAGDRLANLAETLCLLKELSDKGAAYFTQNPNAVAVVDGFLAQDIRYVAHEIDGPHWSALPFSAVARRIGDAGLAFIGSADLAHNYAPSSVKTAFLPLLANETDRARAELHRDYINNTWFRRDIFAKMQRGAPHRDFMRLLEEFRFGSVAPREELRREIPMPDGGIGLEGVLFDGLRHVLASGSFRLADLSRRPEFAAIQPEAIVHAVQLLALGKQIVPFAGAVLPEPAAPPDWTIPLALNLHLLSVPTAGPPVMVIAPALGSAIQMSRYEALVLVAVAKAGSTDAADWAWRLAASREEWLRPGGVPATDRDAHCAAFAQIRRSLATRLPKLVELGVVAPR
jgi:SAM-dependent methyltransferase